MTGKTVRNVEGKSRGCHLKYALAFVAAMMLSVPAAQGAYFENAGMSARPVGMGGVFLAAGGTAADYWYNPAGLSMVTGREAGLTYGLPAAVNDLSISQVNLVTPFGNGGLGVGIAYTGIDVANDMVISGAYGRSLLSDRLNVGVNAKLMRWVLEGQDDLYTGGTDDDLSKMSFSLDLSAMYGLGDLFGLGDFTTGVYLKNAIVPNIAENGDEGGDLPLEAGIGLMMRRGDIAAEADVAFVDDVTFFRLGAESGISGSNLKIRGGILFGSDFEDDTEETDLTLGLGYRFGTLAFDYALNWPMSGLKDTDGKHFISFGVSF